MAKCAACSAPVDAGSGVIVRLRQGGYRHWVVGHECGDGRVTTVPLGNAPIPTNRVQTFVHHVCHGLLMRYPLADVLRFAWKHRDTFDHTALDD